MNIFERFYEWVINMSPATKNFISLLESDEGKIAQGLIDVAIKDIETNGFTTVSFVTAGKDVLAQLIAKEITEFNLQHIIAMLNISVAPLVPVTVASTDPVPVT